MERIVCKSCGKDLEAGTRYCPDCGTPTAGPAKAGGWRRDGIILVGVAVLVIGGYFILREKPAAPQQQPTEKAAIPGHEQMTGAVIDSFPTGYGPLVEQGNAFMDHQNYAMAAEAYRRALVIDSSSVDVRSDFASCLHAMGLPKRALEEFRKVLARDPRHVVAYFNLGVVFHGEGVVDSARYYWKKYLEIDPNGEPAEAAREFLKELDSVAAAGGAGK